MLTPLRSWFRSLADIRRDEYPAVGLMLAYGFLALTSYYVVKPARNSIFVERVGADALPLVYVLTAILVVGFMVLYSKYVERVGRLTLILSSMAALGGALVLFWSVLRGGSGVVSSGLFYIFVKLYPLLLVSQFWLVANLLFTTTQARRLFGPIGVGLILGGIAGSSIAGMSLGLIVIEFALADELGRARVRVALAAAGLGLVLAASAAIVVGVLRFVHAATAGAPLVYLLALVASRNAFEERKGAPVRLMYTPGARRVPEGSPATGEAFRPGPWDYAFSIVVGVLMLVAAAPGLAEIVAQG